MLAPPYHRSNQIAWTLFPVPRCFQSSRPVHVSAQQQKRISTGPGAIRGTRAATAPSSLHGWAACGTAPTRKLPLPRSADPSNEHEIIGCQRARKVVERNLIRSCRNDGVSAALGDDEVRERLHARHTAK